MLNIGKPNVQKEGEKDPEVMKKLIVLQAYRKKTGPISNLPIELVEHIFSFIPRSAFDPHSTNKPEAVIFSDGYRGFENTAAPGIE